LIPAPTKLTAGDSQLSLLPDVGGAIVSFTVGGREVMGQQPRQAIAPVTLGDEDDWVRAWRGGWQLLLPNAGDRSPIAAEGFHGGASQARWVLEKCSQRLARVSWADAGGLAVSRELILRDGGLRVTTEVTNQSARERPILVTEHLVLGGEMLAADARLFADAPTTIQLLAADGSGNEHESEAWPGNPQLAWERVGIGTDPRVGVLTNVPASGVTMSTDALSAQVTWSRDELPFLWLWEEIEATDKAPWFGEYRVVGIEPSNHPDTRGLDRATQLGTAQVISAGATRTWWTDLTITPVDPATSERSLGGVQ